MHLVGIYIFEYYITITPIRHGYSINICEIMITTNCTTTNQTEPNQTTPSIHDSISQLTPYSKVFVQNLPIPHLVKKFATFYATQRYNNMYTRVNTCPCPDPDQCSPCTSIPSLRFILILYFHPHLDLPSGLFLACFPNKNHPPH